MEGLLAELNRNRELLAVYKSIGPAGAFGATMIEIDITNGETAIAQGDTIAMMASYQELSQNE